MSRAACTSGCVPVCTRCVRRGTLSILWAGTLSILWRDERDKRVTPTLHMQRQVSGGDIYTAPFKTQPPTGYAASFGHGSMWTTGENCAGVYLVRGREACSGEVLALDQEAPALHALAGTCVALLFATQHQSSPKA